MTFTHVGIQYQLNLKRKPRGIVIKNFRIIKQDSLQFKIL